MFRANWPQLLIPTASLFVCIQWVCFPFYTFPIPNSKIDCLLIKPFSNSTQLIKLEGSNLFCTQSNFPINPHNTHSINQILNPSVRAPNHLRFEFQAERSILIERTSSSSILELIASTMQASNPLNWTKGIQSDVIIIPQNAFSLREVPFLGHRSVSP